MKQIIFIISLFITFTFFSCDAGDDSADAGVVSDCLPPQLTIINDTEYNLHEIYILNKFDYRNETIAYTDLAPGEQIDQEEIDPSVTISDGNVRYITFIRDFSSTITEEIGVTTETPITFIECYKYELHIMNEDFFLERDGGNYASKSE